MLCTASNLLDSDSIYANSRLRLIVTFISFFFIVTHSESKLALVVAPPAKNFSVYIIASNLDECILLVI